MGLRTSAQKRLARWAARRPHVLLATAPGATAQRLAVEAQVRALGGVLAAAPADADVLVTAGIPDGELSEAVELVWSQVPAPRVRLEVPEPADAGAVLAAAIQRLAATPESGLDKAAEPDRATPQEDAHQDEHRRDEPGHADHEGHRHNDHGHQDDPEGDETGDDEQGESGDDGHEGHQHHAHEGHDHAGMEMPGGLMMADRGADRDGLKLDVLHAVLGPVLPAWPSGLAVRVELQGDLVQSATARLLAGSGGTSGFWSAGAGRRAAAHLDSIGRLLEVVGWSGVAEQARRQRDAVLAQPANECGGAALRDLRRLRRRLERSRGLRRSLAGLGRLGPEAVSRLGLTGPAARAAGRGGDAWARLVTWLEESEQAVDGRPLAPAEGPRGEPGRGSDALLAAAMELMPGLNLPDARLVMASFDPDLDELHPAPTDGDQVDDDHGHTQRGTDRAHEGQVHAA